jgi:uncharacterized membrane protein YkvA (DUF1232 family)
VDSVPAWLLVAGSVAAGIAMIWSALVVVLWFQHRSAGRAVDWREMMRLVPDVLRLVRRLTLDPDVPRTTRWWLLALLGYLLLPIDLIPDFIPVLGFADDAIVVVIGLRFAIHSAGEPAIRRNWPGTPDGLDSLLALSMRRAKTTEGAAKNDARVSGDPLHR